MNDTPFARLMDLTGEAMILGVTKISLVLGFGIYAVFALVAAIKIQRMFHTLNTGADKTLQMIGYIHLGISVLALVWAIVVI